MTLETEYKGYTIRYDSDRDEFVVGGLAYRHIKLSNCKARIDKFDLELRKLDNVRVIEITSHGNPEPYEATSIDASGQEVYVVQRNGNRVDRSKRRIKNLVRDTPENQAAIADILAVRKQIREMEKQAHEMLDALPRLTAAELRGDDEPVKTEFDL